MFCDLSVLLQPKPSSSYWAEFKIRFTSSANDDVLYCESGLEQYEAFNVKLIKTLRA